MCQRVAEPAKKNLKNRITKTKIEREVDMNQKLNPKPVSDELHYVRIGNTQQWQGYIAALFDIAYRSGYTTVESVSTYKTTDIPKICSDIVQTITFTKPGKQYCAMMLTYSPGFEFGCLSFFRLHHPKEHSRSKYHTVHYKINAKIQ